MRRGCCAQHHQVFDVGIQGVPSHTDTDRVSATGIVFIDAVKGVGVVDPLHTVEDIHIVARATGQVVVAGQADQAVVARTAVQAAGLRGLNEGQKVSYEVAMERGKAAATNLKLA